MCIAESNNERFISKPTHQTFMAAESWGGVAVNTDSPASPCDITSDVTASSLQTNTFKQVKHLNATKYIVVKEQMHLTKY